MGRRASVPCRLARDSRRVDRILAETRANGYGTRDPSFIGGAYGRQAPDGLAGIAVPLAGTWLPSFASFAASGPIAAQHQAYGQLYGSILRQSSMIAYLDNFWLLGLSALAMIPFVFLMKRPPRGVSAAAH